MYMDQKCIELIYYHLELQHNAPVYAMQTLLCKLI